MAERSIEVRLRANITQYQAAMGKAAKDTRDLQRGIADAAKANSQFTQSLGRAGIITSGAFALGLGMSAKAAVDFESAMAGVSKTFPGTATQLAAVSDGIRNMSKELPATTTEIASVAEAAGQLGIEAGSVLGFTRTMVDLGETTNMSADEAATALARLANITQMPQSEFDRLGSTVVALGNNLATTESEIVEMGLRIAGAGNQIGLAESDVLGFAAALSSVGIESQAGGSAISKVMIEIASEVETTGDNLATFARVAGMSAQEFSEAYRTDAAGALVAFVEGLGNMEAQGQSAIGVLAELGIEEIRMRDALLRASGAGDLLRESLNLGSEAWEDNTALLTEAEKRYETTASQMEILRNKISDIGVDTGSTLLPALNATVDVLGNFADGLAALPAPAKTATTVIAGTTSVVAGLGGAALLVAPRIKQARDALVGMGGLGASLGNNLGKISAGLAGVGAAVGAGVLLYERATRASREYEAMVTELQQALSPVAEGQQDLNTALEDFLSLQAQSLSTGQIQLMNDLGVSMEDVEQAILAGKDALDPFREAVAELGIDLEGVDLGKLDDPEGRRAMLALADATSASAGEAKDLIDYFEDLDNVTQDGAEAQIEMALATEKFTESAVDAAIAANTAEDGTVNYAAALRDLAPKQEEATDATSDAAGAMSGQEQAAKDAEDAIKALEDAISGLIGVQLSAESAALGAADAYADMEESLADSTPTLDLSTDAGRKNREALSGAADAAMRHVDALIKQGAETDVVAWHMNAYRERLAETMRQAGYTEEQIGTYIDTLGLTPENIATLIELHGTTQAEQEIQTLTRDRAVNLRLRVSEAISGAVNNLADRVVGRHSGGPVPGSGNTDTVPAMLTPGEFVVRKEAVQALGMGTLWRLNAAHFATGGLAGLTGAVLSGPLAGLARREQTAEMLRGTAAGRRAIAGAGDDPGAQMQALRDLADTYLEVAASAGTAAAAQLAAHEYLSEADFDRVAGEVMDTAEALREMASAAEENRRRVQDVRFEIGELGTEEYLGILRERLAGEERYSDEWLAIWTEIDSIETDLVEARTERMEELAEAHRERLEDLADAQEDAFDRLVDLLNQQAAIQAKIEQTTAEHHAKLRDLERSLADDQAAAIRDRADALSSWASIEERAVIRWGNTVGALTANVRDQIDQFAEWQDTLNRARGRGVSDAVIDMLGLAEGPEALGQLRMFMSASEEEIAALNAAVGQRQAQAGEQARRESTQAYSELGRQLADMQAAFAAEVEALNEEFLAEQRALREELASLGQDQGRSYGEAVAEGLRSQIPAVRDAAQALRDAMADLESARSAPASPGASGGSGTLVNTETGRAAFTGPSGEAGYAGKPKGVPGAVSWRMPDGRVSWYVPGEKIQAGNLGALRGYAMGSPFVPSDGPAFLHRGERVFSASDNSALVRAVQQIGTAPPVNVVAEVYVDGQRMVDDRIKVVLRDNRTGKAIAGRR